VKFIRINPPVTPGGNLLCLPAHGQLVKLGNQKRAEQIRIFLAQKSFRQFRQKDFSGVHHLAKVQTILRLRDHVKNRFPAQEHFRAGEKTPQQALVKLRARMIEAYSPYHVRGPVYFLKKK
jgi:hypothetical protein